MPNLSRRVFLGAAVCGALLSGTVACGSEPSGAPDTAQGSVTVTHALGTTTVPPGVARIVALGPTGVDVALALDAPVVGASSSGSESGLAPWTSQAQGASDVEVLPVTGEATEVDIEQVIGRVQTKLDETRAAHPALQGATYTFGFVQPGAVTALRDPDDAMNSVPTALGLSLSPQILALPKGESFGVQLSSEQIASLDADALVLFDGGDAEARRTLEQNPLFERLPVVQRGAVVNYDYDEFIGLRNPSPLSIPWIVDRIAPRLSDAVSR